jgi:hypothetical protein
MKNFRVLTVPNDPLKDANLLIEKYKLQSRSYAFENPTILKDEVIDIFKSLNLDIDSVVVFTTYATALGSDKSRIIHSDVRWDSTSNCWQSISCGVNWELTDVKGTFKWWNMDAVEPMYPSPTQSLMLGKLSGIHYEERMRFGVPNDSMLIEEVYTTLPILVRTDIPHSVTYTGYGRMSISIRFSDHSLSWNDAVSRLSSIIL